MDGARLTNGRSGDLQRFRTREATGWGFLMQMCRWTSRNPFSQATPATAPAPEAGKIEARDLRHCLAIYSWGENRC
jgi:hypothetical protein